VLFFAVSYILAVTSAPTAPPHPPQASNSVYMKSVEEQFQDPPSSDCDKDEVSKEGKCEPMLKHAQDRKKLLQKQFYHKLTNSEAGTLQIKRIIFSCLFRP
jgi:hypothetical protein